MEQTEDNRALQFLIQKITTDVQQGNAVGDHSIVTGLGRVCFSAHGMMIDAGLASDDLNAVLTDWL